MNDTPIASALPAGVAHCPNRRCFDGRAWERCKGCGGTGTIGDQNCPTCMGAGEGSASGCSTCDGTAVVSDAEARLYWADQWVLANDPAWRGANRDHFGVTLYSQAEWWRRRGELWPRVRAVEGHATGQEHLVRLWSAGAAGRTRRPGSSPTLPLITFTGFAWGYGGEGPNGLGDVLRDLFPERFPTLVDALRFTIHADPAEDWSLFRSAS